MGFDVWGLSRFGNGGPRECTAELGDLDSVKAVVRKVRPTLVVHLAAISNVAHGDVAEIYRSNIMGTRNLMEALASEDSGPEFVLLPSSAHVYGSSSGEVLTERSQLVPHNDYAVSKVAAEFVAKIWMERLPICIVRPFNYTGVGQSDVFLIPKIVAAARRGDRHLTLGNLDVERDFSDVRDVAALYGQLCQVRPVGETVNVCSGVTTSLRTIVDMVSDLSGVRFELQSDASFVRSHEVRRLSGSNQKLRSLLDQVAFRPLKDTIDWMLRAK